MRLSDILVILVFGAPSGIISLLVSALGIWKKRPWLLVVAGLLTIPATLYIGLAIGLPLYLLSILQFIGAYYVHKGKPHIAWYLLVPLFLFALQMTYATFYNLFHSPETL